MGLGGHVAAGWTDKTEKKKAGLKEERNGAELW